MAGLWFEEFEVGARFEHAMRRTVTETDNLLFTTMTHNPAALHLDAEAMKNSEFGRIVVNSMFTFGLMVGISVGDTTLGTTIANLGMDEVKFPAPVFIGDTLHVVTTVESVRASKSRPGAGLVVFRHEALNQDDVCVARCLRHALMRRRPAED